MTARRPVRPPRPTQPPPPVRRKYAIPAEALPKPKKQLPGWLQTILITILSITAGFLAQSETLGQITVILYGLAAFIWNIPSRMTFLLALLSMVTTIVLLVGMGNIPLAQNFATYTFLLLVAGVISLGRELKREGGRIYSIRERNINNW